MPPKKRKKKSRYLQTRRLFFNISDSFEKQQFLDLAMEIIGNCDVTIETRLERISIEFQGNPGQIDKIQNDLIILEKQLSKAFNSDIKGFYTYEHKILNKLLSNQLQIKYFVRVIKINGYEANIENSNSLLTNAPFDELKKINQSAAQSLNFAPIMQNKDIRRFLSTFSMKTGKDHSDIARLAVDNNIISERDSIYHFSLDIDEAYNKLENKLRKDFPISSTMEDTVSKEQFKGLGFDGGKIVFISKDGKEQDQSPYDWSENNDIEENSE